MLKKEESNKLLKGIKTIVFATGLTLLNPINVEANNITPQQVEDNQYLTKEIVETTVCGTLLISLAGITIYALNLRKKSKDYNRDYEFKENNAPNEEEVAKHIKVICK